MVNSKDKLKGQIPFPCCPKEKAMVASYKCPNCGKFSIFDFDEMKAYPAKAAKGAAHKFHIEKLSID